MTWEGYRKCRFRVEGAGYREVGPIDAWSSVTVGTGIMRGYATCALQLVPGCDNCSYVSVYGEESERECGSHKQKRLGQNNGEKKSVRIASAFDI